ncbi:MAG TPA: PaaI family thioesterase [Ktedonobacterales bacterium]|nr:PaaI family thioesterase [Ktedonobacterales bacterium]
MMTDQDATRGTPQSFPAFASLPPAGAWLQNHGLVLDEISGTRVTAHIDLGAQHLTPWGVVHGGVYTTAIESVASVGASAAVFEQGQFAVGVNNSTDFLRAMREGTVDIVAEPVIQGRTQQLWRVTITRRDDGKAVAQGQVRLQNVPLAQPKE